MTEKWTLGGTEMQTLVKGNTRRHLRREIEREVGRRKHYRRGK